MFKLKLIEGIINVSSVIQTALINYLEFRKLEPKEPQDKGYEEWKAPPKPTETPEKPFQKDDVIKPHYGIFLRRPPPFGRRMGKER